MRNPFDWQYLSTTPGADEVFGPFGIAFLAVSIVLLLTGAYFYAVGRYRYQSHRLNFAVANNLSLAGLIIGALGVLFFGLRIAGIPFLGWRLWLYLVALAGLIAAIYTTYYLTRVYPPRREQYEIAQRKRKYMPPGAAPSAGLRPEGGRGESRRRRKKK